MLWEEKTQFKITKHCHLRKEKKTSVEKIGKSVDGAADRE